MDQAGARVIVPVDGLGVLAQLQGDVAQAPFADNAALETFVGKGSGWQGLVRMTGMPDPEAKDDPYGLAAVFRDRGLRVRFHEPDLIVDIEATNTIVTRRHATWWSTPQPPAWPGQENLPPEEQARCPRPITAVQEAWISADRRVLALFVHHMQPSCICGDAGGDRWHLVELPAT
jgi:hypothetical protein